MNELNRFPSRLRKVTVKTSAEQMYATKRAGTVLRLCFEASERNPCFLLKQPAETNASVPYPRWTDVNIRSYDLEIFVSSKKHVNLDATRSLYKNVLGFHVAYTFGNIDWYIFARKQRSMKTKWTKTIDWNLPVGLCSFRRHSTDLKLLSYTFHEPLQASLLSF